MKPSRRPKARKIAAAASSGSEGETPAASPAAPAAARPPRPKKSGSKSRLSFGGDDDAGDAAAEPAFAPKKSALSRKAMERNAARKSALVAGVVGIENLSLTPGQERASYSKEALEELKSVQPVTPLATSDGDEDVVMAGLEEEKEDDAADGNIVSRLTEQSEIPDEGLVRMMKQRRQDRAAAGRAGGKDFISLNASDSDEDGSNEIILRPKKKKESRLARRDDFADDDEVENYVSEDARLLAGANKNLQREQERRRKQTIRDAIDDAEGAEDGDSEVSRDSLVEDWERDQVRRGAFSSADVGPKGFEGDLEALAKRPPTVTPLPDLADVLKRLEESLAEVRFRKQQTERQVENVIQEKKEISEREGMVQEGLTKAAAEYERLRAETGNVGAGGEGMGVVDRGLESFGNTPIRVNADAGE